MADNAPAPATTSRSQQLRMLLDKTPGDAFLVYAMALELKKAGDRQGALDHLARVIALDPHYHYAYYQQGQILESLGDTARARSAYEVGIAQARSAGDGKALGELEGALDLL